MEITHQRRYDAASGDVHDMVADPDFRRAVFKAMDSVSFAREANVQMPLVGGRLGGPVEWLARGGRG